MRGLIILFTIGYVLSQAFDAVLRWVLNMGGAAPVIYLRDYSLIFVVIFGCYLLMSERRDVARTFWVLWAVALSGCVALFAGIKVPQMLFGIKVWLPFITGFLLVETGVVSMLNKPRAWALLWLVSCLGVFINYFYKYPWAALLIQVGDVTVKGERGATADGIARLSGFTRANYDAATLILMLYIYLLVALKGRFTRLVLIVFSGAAIALTTTKGATGAFLATLLLAPMLNSIHRPHSSMKGALITGLIVVAALGMVFPLIASQIQFATFREHTLGFWLFSSFIDRATNTWPHALSLLQDWQWITGRGVGGIGAAQDVFEPARANPADSLFIYLYVTAGIFGAALYLFYAFASTKLALHQPTHRSLYMALFAFFAYGITVNMVENAVAAMVLGALTSVLSAPAAVWERRPEGAHHLAVT